MAWSPDDATAPTEGLLSSDDTCKLAAFVAGAASYSLSKEGNLRSVRSNGRETVPQRVT